ncbi:C4-dicarboxylate ABC transporter [Mycobacterium sherrisii]|uniref:C4-dicarboxylate ABC transporter n=2 Tax=Mycobacterium sherrisii TaxID=243061 RepID=A0A1E3SR10_9MYCO|nr:C4-dicarboxylate ABC transporter [Mycobacterium sherrisii]
MATGILSVAAANHHYAKISQTLGALASVGLVSLLALVIMTRRLAHWNLRDPDVTLRLFTFVAACAVLDSRLAAHPVLVWVLGTSALVSWLVLVALSVRNFSTRRWPALRDQAHGAWELASVGTSGLAIVAVKVAGSTSQHWWLGIAVPVWLAGLCSYALMTWLILWRTVTERQDRDGFEPDTWILMGGLAIATLAGENIYLHAPGWLTGPAVVVTVATWAAATLWIPPLIYFGLHRISRRPEMLRFAGVWWALVFPLGMYSTATYTMAAELDQRSLVTVSLVFFWDALATWLIVVAAGLLRARHAVLSGT